MFVIAAHLGAPITEETFANRDIDASACCTSAVASAVSYEGSPENWSLFMRVRPAPCARVRADLRRSPPPQVLRA